MRHHDRIAVRRGLRDEFRCNLAARAAAILDDHLLADRFTQLLRDDAPDDVGAAAGRKPNQHANRLGRIRLRVYRAG